MLDFETSGMSPDQGARITEVAALRIEGDRVVDRFCSLVNCGVRIPSFIRELTGITQAMVNAAPPATEVVPALLDFIGPHALAAHNASFDEKFLRAESERLGLTAPHTHTVCTVKLARRLLPGLGSYSLSALAGHLDLRFGGRAHRAEADADVSARLLLHLTRQLNGQWQMPRVDGALLQALCGVPAARIPAWLEARRSAWNQEQPGNGVAA